MMGVLLLNDCALVLSMSVLPVWVGVFRPRICIGAELVCLSGKSPAVPF